MRFRAASEGQSQSDVIPSFCMSHLETTVTALRLVCAHCRTLPSNLALCVNPEFDYVRARDPATGRVYIVAESRLASIPGAMPKAKKGAKGANKSDAEPKGWQVSACALSLLCWNISHFRQPAG